MVEQRTENPRVTGSIPVLGTQDYKDGDNIHTDTDDLLYNAPTFTEMKVGWDIKNARVVEWYYVALPRRRSRVRSPSRARLKALLRNQEGFFVEAEEGSGCSEPSGADARARSATAAQYHDK